MSINEDDDDDVDDEQTVYTTKLSARPCIV